MPDQFIAPHVLNLVVQQSAETASRTEIQTDSNEAYMAHLREIDKEETLNNPMM